MVFLQGQYVKDIRSDKLELPPLQHTVDGRSQAGTPGCV